MEEEEEKYEFDPSWQPDEAQLQWTRSLIASLKHGGYWGTDNAKYRMDQVNKRLVLTLKFPNFNAEMHRRIVVAFKKCDFEVVEDLKDG